VLSRKRSTANSDYHRSGNSFYLAEEPGRAPHANISADTPAA